LSNEVGREENIIRRRNKPNDYRGTLPITRFGPTTVPEGVVESETFSDALHKLGRR